MNRSGRISKDHEDRLAKLPPEQRKTILGETTRLLKRLRLTTRFEHRFGYKPTIIHISDDDLVEWLKSLPKGSRKPASLLVAEMLTPSEIARLRQEMKVADDFFQKEFAEAEIRSSSFEATCIIGQIGGVRADTLRTDEKAAQATRHSYANRIADGL